MLTRKVIAVVVTIVLGAPAAAVAQDRTDDRVRQDAAALPDQLWEPGSDPVTAAGPALPEDGGGATPLLVVALLLGALGAGYAVSLLRPVAFPESPAPAPQPQPQPQPQPRAAPEREPASAPAPVEPRPEPAPAPVEPAPAPVEPAPLPAIRDAAVARETCVIGLSHAWGRGRFEVRVKDKRTAHRVVASSPAFEVPPGMVIKETGAAGRAHRRLLLHLEAAGWELEPREDAAWYERRLSRPVEPRGGGDVDRALVTTRPEGGEAEFVALALDEFGNARVLARSPRFVRRAGRPVEETETAAAAHGTLLEDLEAHGWRVSGTLESWYGATLARRRRL